MALIFIKLPEPIGDKTHAYDHIECDVEGCAARSPTSFEMNERRVSLLTLGWFVDGGLHRCPEHYHDEVPGVGPQYRDA